MSRFYAQYIIIVFQLSVYLIVIFLKKFPDQLAGLLAKLEPKSTKNEYNLLVEVKDYLSQSEPTWSISNGHIKLLCMKIFIIIVENKKGLLFEYAKYFTIIRTLTNKLFSKNNSKKLNCLLVYVNVLFKSSCIWARTLKNQNSRS